MTTEIAMADMFVWQELASAGSVHDPVRESTHPRAAPKPSPSTSIGPSRAPIRARSPALAGRDRDPGRRPVAHAPAPVVDVETLGIADLADELVRHRDALVLPLARTASMFCDKQAWRLFGYRNARDFARQRFDRTARWLQDLAALGRHFVQFPELARAATGLDGERPLGQQAALWVGRVSTPDTLGDWIDQARKMTLDELGATVRDFTNKKGRSVQDEDPDQQPQKKIRLEMPPEVRVALDETLDLHRAVAAHEGSMAGFLEALCAEAISAGLEIEDLPDPPSVDAWGADRTTTRPGGDRPHPVRWGKRGRPVFDRRSRTSGRRGPRPPAIPSVRRARRTLRQMRVTVRRLDRLEGRIEALSSDLQSGIQVSGLTLLEMTSLLRALVRLDDEIEIRVAELLLELTERRAWTSLGYTSLEHFASARLRMSRTTAYKRVALARGLGKLVHVRDAYELGHLSLSAAGWVVRACRRRGGPAREAEQRAWIEHARGATMKLLRDEEILLCRDALLARGETAWKVSKQFDALKRREAGDERSRLATPSEPSDTSFRVESSAKCGASPVAGMPSSSSDTSFRPERAVTDRSLALGAPSTTGDTSFRNETSDESSSEPFGIPSEARWRESIARFPGRSIDQVVRSGLNVLERVIDRGALVPVTWTLRLPWETAVMFQACVNAMRIHLDRQALLDETHSAAHDARLRPSERIARTLVQRHLRVPEWVGLLGLLELFVLGYDDPKSRGRDYEIAYRDGFRCTAPACSARCTHRHHIVYRSHLGSDDLSNRALACPFHHLQGEHGLWARCMGTAPLDTTWRLGRSDLATWFRNERAIAGPDEFSPPSEPVEGGFRMLWKWLAAKP